MSHFAPLACQLDHEVTTMRLTIAGNGRDCDIEFDPSDPASVARASLAAQHALGLARPPVICAPPRPRGALRRLVDTLTLRGGHGASH